MTGDLDDRRGSATTAGASLGKGEPVRRTYDLNGVMLGIAAAEDDSAAFLDSILAQLRHTPSTACDWMVSVAPTDSIETPVRGTCIFEGPLPEGLPSIMVVDGDERVLVVPGHFAMNFCRPTRTTRILFVPGKQGSMGGTAAFWMLGEVLAAHDRHMLHGALLVDPASERSIAIFAPSGTGKTTTALALARAGFCLAGDDALVLDASEGKHGLWAIPRKINIHRRTAALLPWLDPVLTDAWVDEEQSLNLAALSSLVAPTGHQRRPAGLIIALMPPNQNDHRVAAITKPDALAAIAHDNLRIAPGGVDADNTAALKALAGLIADTSVVSLSVGPDPGSLSRAIIGLR
jgi:hypothetical protein